MQIYSQQGIEIETCNFTHEKNEFYLQKIGTEYTYFGDSILGKLNDSLVILYDTMRDLFFKDTIQYYKEQSVMPIFVTEAGQDSDCPLSSKNFSKLLSDNQFNYLPNFYRHLYLADCQLLIGSIQNLLESMEYSFVNYFTNICDIVTPCSAPDTVMIDMSPSGRNVISFVENYFIKSYAILDRFSKLAYEFESPMTDFSKYNKMISAKILWGDRKNLSIKDKRGTLFEQCDLTKIIEALRNDVIHNGSWELNPKIFIVFKNGQITERFALFPDIEQGHLATVVNRKHFFNHSNKINDILPQIHINFLSRTFNTVEYFNNKFATINMK